MTEIIKLTIQEIVQDFYNLAEEEGYYTGLGEGMILEEKDFVKYHKSMKNMIEKYIPTYKKHVDERYFANDATEDEKGVILSTMLCENFKKMFYELV